MSNEINQKAKELVEKYSIIEIQIGGQYDGYLNMQIEDAKQCALIEIKNTIAVLNKIYKKTPFLSDCEEYTADKIKEYSAIYNEIKKL